MDINALLIGVLVVGSISSYLGRRHRSRPLDTSHSTRHDERVTPEERDMRDIASRLDGIENRLDDAERHSRNADDSLVFIDYPKMMKEGKINLHHKFMGRIL